jgi:hypothetical protein
MAQTHDALMGSVDSKFIVFDFIVFDQFRATSNRQVDGPGCRPDAVLTAGQTQGIPAKRQLSPADSVGSNSPNSFSSSDIRAVQRAPSGAIPVPVIMGPGDRQILRSRRPIAAGPRERPGDRKRVFKILNMLVLIGLRHDC